jgi:glycosyltransferase involved in cell wall biosynthesis
MRERIRVLYVIDVEGWALHNVGLLLRKALESDVELTVITTGELRERRPLTDVVYLSYSGLYEPSVPYRSFADRLIATVHDPCEVTHFTDRFDWKSYPYKKIDFTPFDAISVTSREMNTVLRTAYSVDARVTPTFPFDVPPQEMLTKKSRIVEGNGPRTRFTSAAAHSNQSSLRSMLRRLRTPSEYAFDETGRVSLRQSQGLLVRRWRKNTEWLGRLSRDPVLAECSEFTFRTAISAASHLPSRDFYWRTLADSDVYICSSFMEGGPLPVMEAVCAGNAVISTPVGQVEDWVTDGVNGRIVHSYHELREAALAYATEPELLLSHQAASRVRAANVEFPSEPWKRFLAGP